MATIEEIPIILITVNYLCGFWVLKTEDLNTDKCIKIYKNMNYI